MPSILKNLQYTDDKSVEEQLMTGHSIVTGPTMILFGLQPINITCHLVLQDIVLAQIFRLTFKDVFVLYHTNIVENEASVFNVVRRRSPTAISSGRLREAQVKHGVLGRKIRDPAG